MTIQETSTRIHLFAYVTRTGRYKEKMTAFKLLPTISNYHRITTRYQNAKENISVCSHIGIYRHNVTQSMTNRFSVSCLPKNRYWEGTIYSLEYFISGEKFDNTRKLLLKIPHHETIDERNKITEYVPFIYVDVTDALLFTLYVQPVPKKFNVSAFRIWLINNSTGLTIDVTMAQPKYGQYLEYNFSILDGLYYFRVAALHPSCGPYGCINATSPFISIKDASHRVLIMIISVIWIPPVILYALYNVYKLCKSTVSKGRKKPNCLIVYSPTRESHITVMVELTKYLRECNINAMIDMLDISEPVPQDIEFWCKTAFNCADTILIVTSPPSNKLVRTMFENIDNYILQLIRENFGLTDKKYYILQLPYCKPTDIPDDALRFQRFYMPDELAKLVKTVHNFDYVRFFGLSNKDLLLQSIKLAEIEMLDDGIDHKSADET
ncbi:hypothetical protein V1478_011431, partial [Vespula squamosa]